MDDLNTLKMRLEYIYLREIIDGLRQKKTTIPDTKLWAHEFLTMEPFSSKEDAQQKVSAFCQKYPQFSRLEEYMNSYIKEENVDATIDKMRERIKANDLDGALQIAKGDS